MPTFLGCLGVITLLAGLTVGGWFLRGAMLPGRAIDRSLGTAEGIIDKTLTAENAIYNYEWFKKQKEDIDALDKKYAVAVQASETFKAEAGPREKWTFEDKGESSRLAAIAQGLKSQYLDAVALYNARAKMANRSIFLDGKIPGFIEVGSQFLK